MPMTHRYTLELRRLQRDSHSKCCLCGCLFREGDTAHAGYDKDGLAVYVGDCCSNNLIETAVRTYWQSLPYVEPGLSSKLWRYLDYSKFVALLKEKSIYFARADCLGDDFEGAKGIKGRKNIWDDHYLRFFRHIVKNPPPGYGSNLSEEEVEREARRLLSELAEAGEMQRRTNYVSCWHESEVESEALWRLYCPPQTAGVALQTNFSSLRSALGDKPDIIIGRVQYVDFRKGFAGTNESIFRKRKSLSHEQEVRAVVMGHENDEARGIHMPVDIEKAIERVVVSPYAPHWFKDVLQDTMMKYDVHTEIATSELSLEPFF